MYNSRLQTQPQANRILNSLKSSQGDACNEVVLLDDRIRACSTIQSLVEGATSGKLYLHKDLEKMMLDIKDVWQQLPAYVKTGVTLAFALQHLEELAGKNLGNEAHGEALAAWH